MLTSLIVGGPRYLGHVLKSMVKLTSIFSIYACVYMCLHLCAHVHTCLCAVCDYMYLYENFFCSTV